MVMQNFALKQAPKPLDGIEPTGIGRQKDRRDVKLFGQGQDGRMLMDRRTVILNDVDGTLGIVVPNGLVQRAHLLDAKLVALLKEELTGEAI